MATVDEIVRAVETVAGGRHRVSRSPPVGRPATRSACRRRASSRSSPSSPRASSNAEIAERLSLRVKTVESQLRRLFDRYDVTSRTALVRLAARQGWIEEDR